MVNSPALSISAACGGWSETTAAYGLFNCDAFPADALIAPHRQATVKRCAGHSWVAVSQDTTEFDFTHMKGTDGLGPLNGKERRGFFMHSLYAVLKMKGGHEGIAREKMDRSTAPPLNGLRLLAAHRTFSPSDPEVAERFEALGSDPIYRMMCLKQQYFGARGAPKPWRLGIKIQFRMSKGVWPIKPEHLPARREWIASYEKASKGFSSCTYVETKGNGSVDPAVAPVMEWHAELCRFEHPGLSAFLKAV